MIAEEYSGLADESKSDDHSQSSDSDEIDNQKAKNIGTDQWNTTRIFNAKLFAQKLITQKSDIVQQNPSIFLQKPTHDQNTKNLFHKLMGLLLKTGLQWNHIH